MNPSTPPRHVCRLELAVVAGREGPFTTADGRGGHQTFAAFRIDRSLGASAE